MSVSSAKAKLDAQAGDPATGYISKQDHKDSYDQLVADTALTGTTTAAAITVSGAVQVGATSGLVVGASGPKVLSGSGSPEGAVTAPVGSVFMRTDGGADTVAYWKTSGTGNSGWTAVDTGTGDVVGPASASDNAVARFDGTTGKLVQNSGVIVDDSNNVSGVGTLSCGAITASGDLTVSKASAGLIVSASSGNPGIYVSGVAGTSRLLRFQTSGTDRWYVGTESTSESGGNAGSDFGIYARSDAGGAISTPLFINRSTGKTTLGAVGATAGLELGSSGPRVMSGTGSPQGVVTAPVGSTWIDTSATTGAVQWIKASGTGNTGWKVQYGDTGWRAVGANLINGWTATHLRVRRVGETVSWSGYNINGTAATSDTFINLPSGFEAVFSVGLPVINYGGTYYTANMVAGTAARASITTGTVFQVTYMTASAWPSSLPGSVA